MKKIGWYLTILFFSIISFFLTHKTTNYLKQKDKLMLFLKNIEDEYYQKPLTPVIENDTIVPGLNGYRINVDKSYNRLKKVGSFNEQLLVYDQIKIKDSLSNYQDKYIISGNPKKKMVSILLYSDELVDLDVPLNYIVSYSNLNDLSKLIKEKDNILIYNINEDNFNNASKLLSKQKNRYCFNEDKDNDYKNICYQNNYYSISTSVITNN